MAQLAARSYYDETGTYEGGSGRTVDTSPMPPTPLPRPVTSPNPVPSDGLPPPINPSDAPIVTPSIPPAPYPTNTGIVPPHLQMTWIQAHPMVIPVGIGLAGLLLGLTIGIAVGSRKR